MSVFYSWVKGQIFFTNPIDEDTRIKLIDAARIRMLEIKRICGKYLICNNIKIINNYIECNFYEKYDCGKMVYIEMVRMLRYDLQRAGYIMRQNDVLTNDDTVV